MAALEKISGSFDTTMRLGPTIMVVGLGDLGAAVLELLAREEGLGQIVVCSRRAARGVARCNLARMGAIARGCEPFIRFVALDINKADAVAETVEREAPDLIFSAAALETWWLADLLPDEQAKVLKKARFGAWLPVHLTLTLKLMRALCDANYRGITLTAPFPDVVNCVLGKLGLAPTCGVGNLDEIVPKLRLLAAEQLGKRLDAIDVVLVAHHALHPAAFGEPMAEIPPYHLRIYFEGQDVSEKVDAHALLLAPYPLTHGPPSCSLTAASTVNLIRALLSDGETYLHAPAPHGLPGGYPVIVRDGDVEPASIEGLTLGEAIDINERSHRFDGVERIEDDGTVVFCAQDVEVLRNTLGCNFERLNPAESEDQARELIARFREYARRHGVDLACRPRNI
jgi:NAD(P)-dependent dehydrogenase (short-subunit alcohol dehydrogenase family)